MTLTIQRPEPPPPVVADGTRREFIAGGLTLAALLAGCGGEDEPELEATRRVRGDFGVVEVPTRPKRVMTTYTDTLDLAVALELPLAAAPGARGSAKNPFPAFLPDAPLRGVKRINTYPDQSIEEFAATRPDLILNSYPDRKLHDQLSQIAPTITIAPEAGKPTWQQIITRLAAAFGKQELAERLVRERRELARSVRTDVEHGRFAGATFAAGYAGAEEFSLYGADIAPCPMLEELGLRILPSAPKAGAKEAVQSLSLERLGDMRGADLIFVTGNPPEGGYEPDRKVQGPLRNAATWKGLPAVRANAVFDYPVDLVFKGPGSDRALLALLREQLTSRASS